MILKKILKELDNKKAMKRIYVKYYAYITKIYRKFQIINKIYQNFEKKNNNCIL